VRDTLRLVRDRWRATRELSWGGLARPLRAHVTGILSLTDSVAGEMQPLLDRVLSVQGDGARLAIELGARIDEVLAAQDVARGQPRVLPHPHPVVLFMKYGESSLDFEVRFWSRFDEWLEARSELLVAIYAALAAHGIEIPFPQRDLHIRTSGTPPIS
jgi:hypothetical protein